MSRVSADRSIANAILRLVLFVLVAKGLGALKEVGLAAYYGVGPVMDAYLLNFSIANTLASTWLGILSVILVPLLIHQHNPALEAELFRGELIGWTVLVGATFALIYALIMPGVAKLSAIGLPVATASLVSGQAIFLCALVPVGFLSGLATIFLLSYRKHISSLTEGVPALVLLAAILLSEGQELALIWGTVAGWGMQLLILVALLRWAGQWPQTRWSRRSSHWRTLWTSIGVLAVAHALASVYETLDNFFAAGLGEGGVSTLSYANRLLGVATGLGALILARATLPVFSDGFVSRPTLYRPLVLRWATLAAAIGAISLVLGWQLAPWAVRLLFERGSFDAADSARVTELLRLGLIQLPVYLPGVVLAGGLAAAGAYRAMAWAAALGLIVKIAANVLLINRHGIEGIPIATAIMYGASLVCCVVTLHIFTRDLPK